jgi:hypothetical protein
MPLLPSLSSSSANPSFTLFTPSQNPHSLSKFSFKIPIIPLHSYLTITSCSSQDSATPALEESLARTKESGYDVLSENKVLIVRRPVMDVSSDGGGEESDEGGGLARSSAIDAGLTEFAKKMPMFEPERVEGSPGSQERPLVVNLDLALYRAKFLARSYRYDEAEDILDKVCDKLTLVLMPEIFK